jgi:hypothetical protein
MLTGEPALTTTTLRREQVVLVARQVHVRSVASFELPAAVIANHHDGHVGGSGGRYGLLPRIRGR